MLLILVAFTPSYGKTPGGRTTLTSGTDDVFNLAEFGAAGDGITDDGPALQNALDAIAAVGGGTLFVPAGRYAIGTPVQKDFSGLGASLKILGVESLTPVPPPNSPGDVLTRGLDLQSEFAPRTGPQVVAIRISGLQSFLIKDITFIGQPDVNTDAEFTLTLTDVWEATIRHCEFYGLSSLEGGSIVLAVRSHLNIEQSVFLGSTCSSGYNAPVVQNLEWKGVTITDAVFADYGQRAGFYGKLGLAAPYSWVNIGNAAAPGSSSPRREATIKDVFLDEGGFFGISSTPYRYLPVSAPIDLIYISGLHMNVTNLAAYGNYLNGPQRALIVNSHYGWSHNADAAIYFLGVGNAILDQVECVDGANRIRADAATQKLTVINSIYTFLDSQSPQTKVITTATAEDDPVQYVHRRFNTLLGRDPDPAAHFYWSDRLLQCDGATECLNSERAALETYLNSTPEPSFSVTGTVTDINGAALTGIVVTLSGSQSVTTQTGPDGRFSFSNLPTSGVYTVVVNDSNYLFSPASINLNNLGGDQNVGFSGTLIRSVEFGASSYSVLEGDRRITVSVVRGGDTSSAAEVIYSATDGSAQQRSDVIPVVGRLSFAPGQTSGSFNILVTDDSHIEGNEDLTLQLHDVVGGALGQNSSAMLTIIDNDDEEDGANPIDSARFFVRQQYRDFLNRTADAAGLAFWSDQITSCGTNAACIADRRINVSAAFFLSIEFQETGFLVYRLYKASFGEQPEHLNEFLLDTRTIGQGVVVNAPGWQELLEANKVALVQDFVSRPQFEEEYPNELSPVEFVNRLNARAGGALSANDFAAVVAEFGGAATSEDFGARARVLRRVAESQKFTQQELNPAFVLQQYFGYLQRNPYETPDNNLDGYNFWLTKLNEFNGDFRRADMVKSFLVSAEYRERFGAP